MKFHVTKLDLIIICFVLATSCNSRTRGEKWLSYLVNHINSCEIHQVLLIYDQSQSQADYEFEHIIKSVAQVIPVWKITSNETTDQKANGLSLIPSFRDPRATTLIVIIDASGSTQLLTKFRYPMSFLTKLSEARSRPKCLIIFLKRYKQSSYENLLRQLWSKRFLDTTVLEITRNGHKESIGMMYNLNPFTDSLIRGTYQQKSNLFPEKSKNLYGYSFQVDLFNQPPLAYVSRNSTGHVKEVFGPEAAITEMLSKAMNFKIVWISSNDTFWGVSGCNKNKSTGALYRLTHNQIQFFAIETGRGVSCIGRLFEWSVSTKMSSVIIVVPNIIRESNTIIFEWRFDNVFIVISILLLCWILTRLMNFHQHNWRFPHLIQIVFGLGAPLEPQRVVERIILGSFLLSCFFNSTFIYTAITEVIHKKQPRQAINTIQDVLDSRFQPIVDPVIRFYIYNSMEGSSRRLLDKATGLYIRGKECLDLLIRNKSIACIVQDHAANSMVQNERDKDGHPSLIVVKEYLMTSVTAFPLESASPFSPRINDILLRMFASGVLEKIYLNRYNASVIEHGTHDSNEEEKPDLLEIRRHVSILLIVGYSCSLLAFLCEIFASTFLKKNLFKKAIK